LDVVETWFPERTGNRNASEIVCNNNVVLSKWNLLTGANMVISNAKTGKHVYTFRLTDNRGMVTNFLFDNATDIFYIKVDGTCFLFDENGNIITELSFFPDVYCVINDLFFYFTIKCICMTEHPFNKIVRIPDTKDVLAINADSVLGFLIMLKTDGDIQLWRLTDDRP
jgi:hypothetical protein